MKNIVQHYIKGDRLSIWKKRLLQLRRENQWTQEELAAKLDEQTELLYRWENGHDLPNMEQVLKISRLAGRPLGYIMALDIPAIQEDHNHFPSETQFRSPAMLQLRQRKIMETLDKIEAQLDNYKTSRPDYLDMIELYLHQIDENYQRLRQIFHQQKQNNTTNSSRSA